MRKASLIPAVLAVVAVTHQAIAQGSERVVGFVYSRPDGVALPNTVVRAPDLGVQVFTDPRGMFELNGKFDSTRIEFRRIGFAPHDTLVVRGQRATDSLHIELVRVAVPLKPVHVVGLPPCLHPGPPADQSDTVLVLLFSQLSLNASQYRLLAESYPFTYVLKSQLGYVDSSGAEVVSHEQMIRVDGLPKWQYRRGRVTSSYVSSRGRGTQVNIPTLLDLASREFVNNHCFHYGGTSAAEERPAHRIDFVPAIGIKPSDFAGQILLDTASFQIRQIVFELSPPLGSRTKVTMTVTTDFTEILPSIAVISAVYSTQTITTPKQADVRMFEKQRLLSFSFSGRHPEGRP